MAVIAGTVTALPPGKPLSPETATALDAVLLEGFDRIRRNGERVRALAYLGPNERNYHGC